MNRAIGAGVSIYDLCEEGRTSICSIRMVRSQSVYTSGAKLIHAVLDVKRCVGRLCGAIRPAQSRKIFNRPVALRLDLG